MKLTNKYYRDNKLHIYSSEIDSNHIKLKILNRNNCLVKSITVEYINEIKEIEVNTKELFFDVEFSVETSYYTGEVKILKAIIDNEEITFKYLNYIKIKSPNRLYKKDKAIAKEISKKVNKPLNSIAYFPFAEIDYWACYCGNINFSNECSNCGCDKNELFSGEEISTNEGETYRRSFKDSLQFVYLLLAFFLHIVIVNIFNGGDIFYNNQDLISFFSVVNRFILPVVILIGNGLETFVDTKDKKTLKLAFLLMQYLPLLYLNILLFISIANISNDVFLIAAYDLVYAIEGISSLRKELKLNVKGGMTLACIISIVFSFSAIIYLKKYSFTVGINYIDVNPNDQEVYSVPTKINNLPVKVVSFKENKIYTNIEEINISKNVTTIEVFVARNLPNLKRITLDENNDNFYIENEVLYYKKNNAVALVPSGKDEVIINVEKISAKGFSSWDNLKKVYIGDNVKYIGNEAFYDCINLENIEFSKENKLIEVGGYAFSGCRSLQSISFPDSVEKFNEGYLYNCSGLKEIKIPYIGDICYSDNNALNLNVYEFMYCNYMPTNIVDKLTLTNQKILQDSSFYKCNIKEIVLNPMEGSIGRNCFKYSKLEKIIIPEGIEELKSDCFYECKNLKEVVLPSTLKTIGKNAFKGDENIKIFDVSKVDLENLTIESGNESISQFLK